MEVDQEPEITGSQSESILKTESEPALNGTSEPMVEVKDEPKIDATPQKPVAQAEEDRLVISKIVNHNFKSYAGTVVLGPFHKNFSCIIGPNGSGKSNVIDSMLFVFGFRGSKIRSKKLSVLIHSSEEHPNCTSCSVEVHFQRIRDLGDDDFTVVPGSDFYVSRSVSKSNSSTYTINGRNSTVKEVCTLLKASGIDLDHNRFLILQGEVEQISLMKPKAPSEHEDGILEYLEDIIGTSIYKEPIEELGRKVEELNEARGEKLNRVKVAEKEKASLEGPKNEACQYMREENELSSKKHILSQLHIHGCGKLLEKATTERDEQKEQLETINKGASEIIERKGTLEGEIVGEEKLLKKLAKESATAKEEFKEFERRDLKVREDIKHNKAKIKKLKTKLESEKKKLSELVDLPGRSTAELEELGSEIKRLEGTKVELEEEIDRVKAGLQPKIAKMTEQREAISAELMDVKKVVNEWQSKVSVTQSELALLTNNKRKKEAQLTEARATLERVTADYKQHSAKVKELVASLPLREKALAENSKQLENTVREEKALSEKLSENKAKYGEAKSALNASTSRSRLLEGLLREKKAGRLPGVCGRLGDLGTIDDRFDVAISTACGRTLNNIVCDTMDTAQKALQFVKTNNLGIATFIALDKMEPFHAKSLEPINLPNRSKRLFDLVKQKEGDKYRGAFYFALRNTLVTGDTDTARSIAYGKEKRWRVVTEGGVMIETSGSMAGGGKSVIRGLMSKVSCEVDPREVDRMSEDISRDQSSLTKLTEDRGRLEGEVRELQRQLNSDRMEKQKCEQALKSHVKQQKRLEGEIPVLEKQLSEIAPDEGALDTLNRRLNAEQLKLDEVLLVAGEKDKLIQRCEEEVNKLNKKHLKPQQDSLSRVDLEMNKAHDKITNIKVSLKGLTRNKDKLEGSIVEVEENLGEATEHMEGLKKEFREIEAMAEEVIDKDNNAQERIKEQSEKMERLRAELAETERRVERHEADTQDYRHKLEQCEAELKENNAKIRHWKKEMGKLSIQRIPGGEEEEQSEPFRELPPEELEELRPKELQYEITVAEERLKERQPNLAIIKEYLAKHAHWSDKVAEFDRVTADRDSAREEHEGLRKKRLSEFMTGFLVITNKLKEMYQMITLGGDAELELVDTLDPFSEGIVFSVRPPKKSWKNISNLSGGEKTLSSLALVFALHHYKPSPLYVMDEIDAALDFKNVSIVAHYIKERTKNAQFIIISLRNNMFELGDRLVGIYKTHNATKTVALNPSALQVSG